MIDFRAVRVGFVTQLLWSRYGAFWRRLVADAGATEVLAESAAVRLAVRQDAVAAVPTMAFRLAAAQASALATCDLLVVPHINLGSDVERGGGQDHWVADFPQALSEAVPGLPPLVAVPAGLGPEVEPVAVPLLRHLLADPARVGRVWARHRVAARTPPRLQAPRWTVAGRSAVGLVGQAWNLSPAVAAALEGDAEHVVSLTQFDPALLRDEGLRGDGRLVPSDAEVIGAARLFSRRGAVDRLRFVADRESGADAWLYQRVREVVAHKDVEFRELQDILDDSDLVDAALLAPSDDGR